MPKLRTCTHDYYMRWYLRRLLWRITGTYIRGITPDALSGPIVYYSYS